MKLWHISQTKNTGYDTYSDAVVATETEDEAKLMYPGTDGVLTTVEDTITNPECWASDCWVNDPSDVTCKLIGTAVDGTPKGVICASFHAG